MFLIVLFPLLALGSIAAVAMLSDVQHEDRWVLNERHACCEERAISKQLTSNFVSKSPRNGFMEFEPADIAA
jgi:hypothetical protein